MCQKPSHSTVLAMKPKMFSAGLDWMMSDRQLPPTDKNKQKEPSHNEMTLYIITGNFLSSQAVSSQVLSAYMCLTTVFGMGTGGTT